jgi:hypothetical protein
MAGTTEEDKMSDRPLSGKAVVLSDNPSMWTFFRFSRPYQFAHFLITLTPERPVAGDAGELPPNRE